jgi:hypothetical protein
MKLLHIDSSILGIRSVSRAPRKSSNAKRRFIPTSPWCIGTLQATPRCICQLRT